MKRMLEFQEKITSIHAGKIPEEGPSGFCGLIIASGLLTSAVRWASVHKLLDKKAKRQSSYP